MLGFHLFRFFIADLHILSQVLGDIREVEAKPSHESLQNKPNMPKVDDPRQNTWPKAKHKTRRSGSRRAWSARAHHG